MVIFMRAILKMEKLMGRVSIYGRTVVLIKV
jgi:hypothetical protein